MVTGSQLLALLCSVGHMVTVFTKRFNYKGGGEVGESPPSLMADDLVLPTTLMIIGGGEGGGKSGWTICRGKHKANIKRNTMSCFALACTPPYPVCLYM